MPTLTAFEAARRDYQRPSGEQLRTIEIALGLRGAGGEREAAADAALGDARAAPSK